MTLTDFEAWGDSNPRSEQVALGPSDIARCLRQAAYAHHHVPPTNPQRSEKARHGSLIHLGWSKMVAERRGEGSTEVEVYVPGLRAPGHADDVDWEQRVVNDVKTKGDTGWHTWVTRGVPDDVWDQVELYAYGLICTEESENPQPNTVTSVTPWTLAITAINRESGEEARFERPANPDAGRRLAEHLAARQRTLDDSTSPEQIPREGSGPATGFPCDYCPWMDQCWPKSDDPTLSPQSQMIRSDPAMIAVALADYAEAQAVESKAAAMKKSARAFLQGLPPGDYGDYTLAWSGGRPLPDEPDKDAAVRKLADLGLDVPMATGRKSRSAIQVRRKPPEPQEDRL